MDVNMDEDLDIQIPEEKDILLFVDNLVDYIRFKSSGRNIERQWKPVVFSYPFLNAALPIILRAIDFLDSILEKYHVDLFQKIKEANFVNIDFLANFSATLSDKCFIGGSGAKYFLPFCLTVSTMADYFYCYDIKEAPNLVEADIRQIFENYYGPESGYNSIYCNAEKYVKMLRGFLNELTPSEIWHASHEIVDSDEEMSNESNHSCDSFSEEESVLSGSVESNIEEQKERALSNIRKYLELYAQSTTNSEYKIGLCSLEEPESLSEDEYLICIFEGKVVINESEMNDKPRPCTSLIFDEFILNISDFKTKVKLSWNEMKSGN